MNTANDMGALVLRLALGAMYLAHAQLKIFTFGLPGTAAFFAQVGFPGWTAYPVTLMELAAGILLVLGLHARWVAVGMIPILLGAAWTHAGNGWVFSGPGGGWEYPMFLIIASAVQGLIGNGALALRAPYFPLPARA
jgi:putative oxidoreductase